MVSVSLVIHRSPLTKMMDRIVLVEECDATDDD